MKKFVWRFAIFFLFLPSTVIISMDSPPPSSPRKKLGNSPVSPRKKIDGDCVKTFQLFNPERAREASISLKAVTPEKLIITPDEKAIVAALGNGQVIFRKIVGIANDIELIADGVGVKGAPMIAVGQKKEHDEIIVAFAVNHKDVSFYDGVEVKKIIARIEVWSKTDAGNKNAFFIQKKMKRLGHYIQDIGINAQGAHTIATIEFPMPFLKQNRSSLAIYNLEENQSNAAWSREGAWWSGLVVNDEGTSVACADIRGAIWLFEIKKVDGRMALSPATIIETRDNIVSLNYPSGVMMWYVTDNHQLKKLEVHKHLAGAETFRCLTTIDFEEVFPAHRMFVMENSPKLSVAYWSCDSQGDDGTSIFFRRENDVFGQDDASQKMTCDMGYVLSNNFPCENDSGQRVMEKNRIVNVALRGNLLVTVTSGGKMKVFKLTEGCGLVFMRRSKSEGEILSQRSRKKSTKTVKKEDNSDARERSQSVSREKSPSADGLSDSPESTRRPRIKSLPRPRRVSKTIGTEKPACDTSTKEKRPRKFSITEYPQTKSHQKGQSPEFQRALQLNIISDFVNDEERDNPKNK